MTAVIDLQPTLRGEHVELRPLRTNDWDELFAVASDPLIWEQHPARDRCQEGVFRVFFREALACGGAFAVLDVRSGRIIGSTRYHGHDPERSEIEIGWTFLARAHWGGRHNGEMKRLMLDHILRFVDRAVFFVGLDNQRSQKAMERIGGVNEGVVRKGVDGRTLEHVQFVITREAWAARRASSG